MQNVDNHMICYVFFKRVSGLQALIPSAPIKYNVANEIAPEESVIQIANLQRLKPSHIKLPEMDDKDNNSSIHCILTANI